MAITLLSNPVGIAVVALAALAAGLYYVGTNINEIKEKFAEFGAKVSTVIDGVKATVIGGISSAVETAKSLLGNLGTIAGSVIKMPINAGINVVNGAIGGINQLAIDVPSWVPGIGGKHLGFNIPTIPALATGGIAVSPTLAMIGEGKESEAILPLSKLETLIQTPKGADDNVTMVFNVTINGGNSTEQAAMDFASIVKQEISRYFREQRRLSLGRV